MNAVKSEKQEYLPSEIRVLKNLMVFVVGDQVEKSEYGDQAYRIPREKVHLATDKQTAANRAAAFAAAHNGRVYTGHHKEMDWSRSYYWDLGFHLCNKTNEWAVVW